MRTIFSLLLIGSFLNLFSQDLELGLWGGTSFYQGDLSSQEISDGFALYRNSLEPAGGIFMRMNPSKALSFELGLNLGKISGEDGVTNTEETRDFNFRSRITELALKANINLFRVGNAKKTQMTPYLMGGISVFRFNPEREFDGNFIELQPLGTEGQGIPGLEEPYSLTSYALLMGGGLKFTFNNRFTIGFELGARKTFTDYLDDVSGLDVDYFEVLENNGSLAAELSNPKGGEVPEGDVFRYTRGGDFEDWFFMSGISFSFAFGGGSGVHDRGIGCPTF